MKSVEDLDVFKLAHQLALKTYSTTKVFPREETFSLVDQMRRAATSVGMNLIETYTLDPDPKQVSVSDLPKSTNALLNKREGGNDWCGVAH